MKMTENNIFATAAAAGFTLLLAGCDNSPTNKQKQGTLCAVNVILFQSPTNTGQYSVIDKLKICRTQAGVIELQDENGKVVVSGIKNIQDFGVCMEQEANKLIGELEGKGQTPQQVGPQLAQNFHTVFRQKCLDILRTKGSI